VFIAGWLGTTGRAWGRPVDLAELPDGSLLVSDDHAGVIYRITYRRR
jgi:glucose/arabinose dehydrogenase